MVRSPAADESLGQDSSRETEFEFVIGMEDDKLRRAAWDKLIKTISTDPTHPAWNSLGGLLDASRRLPITTFEGVAALTRCSQAAAYVGLTRAREAWLWERLQHLPFLWALIPIQCWTRAARCFADHVRTAFAQADLAADVAQRSITEHLNGFFERAPVHCCGMETVCACIRWLDGVELGIPAIPDHRLLTNQHRDLVNQIEHARSRLIDEHIQDWWPTKTLPIPLECQSYMAMIPPLSEKHGHQTAVLQAPVLAAAYSVLGITAARGLVADLQELRGFDPEWFDQAHANAMFLLAGKRLAEDEHCFDP